GRAGPLGRDRIQLPVDAEPAGPGKIFEGIEGQVDQASRHPRIPTRTAEPTPRPPPSPRSIVRGKPVIWERYARVGCTNLLRRHPVRWQRRHDPASALTPVSSATEAKPS